MSKGTPGGQAGVQVPYLTVANVQDGWFDLTRVKEMIVPPEKVDRYRLRPGDLLLTEGGDADKLGRGHIWDGRIDPCIHQNHVFVVRVSDPALDPVFLAHYVRSAQGKAYFRGCAKQTTNLATINSTQLKAMPIPLPDIAEQRSIGALLTSADRQVALLERVLEQRVSRCRLVGESLLTGRLRFPDFTAGSWKDHRLGEYLREVAVRYDGHANPVVLSCSKLYGVLPQTERFGKRIASRDISNYKMVEPGDLVLDPMLLWDGSIGFTNLQGLVSPDYRTFRFIAPDADPRFFAHLFRTERMLHVYRRLARGSNFRRRRAPMADFLREKLPIPEPEEQRKIADVLDLMDREVLLVRDQLALLKQQKQALAEKLLSGELRLREFRE